MLLAFGFIAAAIVILYFGAEITLESAEKVGKRLGLSPLTIGMLLVGFGTSLPEFFVGHIAGIRGQPGIAMGSLIGSNIANMFLILGICGMFARLNVQGKSLREHLFVHLSLAFVLVFVLNQSKLNLITASPLLGLLLVYLYFIYKDMKRMKENRDSASLVADPGAPKVKKSDTAILVLKMNFGFGLLYVGGELLVKGGTDFGLAIGISEYIISAIFIAFGTSFPELVTAAMAAYRKKDTDIIIGNIVGSNLFNCAFILGSLGIYEFNIDQSFKMELVALFIGSIVLVVLNFIKRDLYRFVGVLFFCLYLASVGHWLEVY